MEWKECTIGNLGRIITGKTPKTSIEENYGGEIPFLSPSDNMSNKTAPQTAKTITEIGLKEVKNCLLPPKSICVSCIGSDLGKVVITDRRIVTNQQINSIIPDNSVDADYVYYLMCIIGKELNFVSKTSTAVPIINKSTFSNWEIKIHKDKVTQSRIASILSSLDSKIETNNKINAKLEEMAQALFKSWFVDFEPFKDKGMVESELGMIPEGWRVGKLSEIAEVAKKSINPSKQPDTLFSHYSLPAFDENKLPAKQYGSEIMSNKFIFSNKTTLLSKLNPHIKRIWYVEETEDNAICSTEFLPFKAKDVGLSAFLYSYLVSDFFYLKALSIVQGATNSHQRLDAKVLLEYELPINDEAMLSFDKIVSPMLATICKNRVENSRLSNLRDTLLPKLMSGEIDLDSLS